MRAASPLCRRIGSSSPLKQGGLSRCQRRRKGAGKSKTDGLDYNGYALTCCVNDFDITVAVSENKNGAVKFTAWIALFRCLRLLLLAHCRTTAPIPNPHLRAERLSRCLAKTSHSKPPTMSRSKDGSTHPPTTHLIRQRLHLIKPPPRHLTRIPTTHA